MWGAGKMTKEEIEGVGFEYCDCAEMMQVVGKWWVVVVVVMMVR
jgi:hypothetical protein